MQNIQKTIEEIENKVKPHTEEFQKLNTYITENDKSVQKLTADKEIAKARLHVLSGAIQAYEEILKDLKNSDSPPSEEISDS